MPILASKAARNAAPTDPAPGPPWQPPRITRLESIACVVLAVVMLVAGLLAR
jgi:hypothetical protein